MQNNCYDGDISLGPAKLPGQLYCSQTAWAVLWHVFDAGKATGVWIQRAADKNKTVTKWANRQHFKISSKGDKYVLYMGHTVKHHLFQNKALYT